MAVMCNYNKHGDTSIAECSILNLGQLLYLFTASYNNTLQTLGCAGWENIPYF